MNREWRPVVGYEGLYEVSNYGEVRSFPRAATKGGVLKGYHSKHNGYVYVSLSKENRSRTHRVHKLVLEAFTGYRSKGFNPEAVIDHIDGDKANNCLWNLEVVTQKENDRRARAKKQQVIHTTPVIDLDTLQVYPSVIEAAISARGSRNASSKITLVCQGKRSHYRGRRFAKLSDYQNGTIPEYQGKVKRKVSVSLWR